MTDLDYRPHPKMPLSPFTKWLRTYYIRCKEQDEKIVETEANLWISAQDKQHKIVMKFFFVMLLVVCVDLFLGSPINEKNSNYWNKKQTFCGSKLPIEMAIICRGRYNLDPRSQHPKKKRGIVDECCSNSCTRKYLKEMYCAPELPTSAQPKSEIIETTTETIKTEFPVDYRSYYYALIGRVKADPQDYPRHG
ncbi:uncharacterized protein LOC111028553 [Myzus persicae]|uniref:uncharacterized protein LOC111028553 n=1 Tax=Myzus persicae TaxID=13164 RepID=UPI000B931A16|nr:uncharacterized protein LOC111028553 [Myzus persicae]